MKKQIFLGLLAVLLGAIGIVAVLSDEKALIVNPKGIIARAELELIVTNILLMLVIIVPTYLLIFFVVWKYCIKKEQGTYDPEHKAGATGELLMWVLPTLVVAALSIVTWEATHKLNPYRPIESNAKPLTVQVVALNWKWLFIYPELGIATLNYFCIPEQTPIHIKLTADQSPMNSFWIPQLSGQIYAMTGMTTQLFLMADGIGEYAGRAVEINGEGYSDMTFTARSLSSEDFENWVKETAHSSSKLTDDRYAELVKPYVDRSIILFSGVEKNLFHQIVHRYMYPTAPVL